MHGLETLSRLNNNAAVAAGVASGAPKVAHLAQAPVKDNLDFNIPWDYNPDSDVLTVAIHENTETSDLIKLVQHVSETWGLKFSTVIERY